MHNRRVKSVLRHTDNLTPNERRKAMRAVRSRDTAPERRVASALKAIGIRFREQADDLPGNPDFVLPGLRAAVFVQGCFWHVHGCRSVTPRANRSYWKGKLASNARRDRRVRRALNRLGWSVVAVWECQLGPGVDVPTRTVLRAVLRARQTGYQSPVRQLLLTKLAKINLPSWSSERRRGR